MIYIAVGQIVRFYVYTLYIQTWALYTDCD